MSLLYEFDVSLVCFARNFFCYEFCLESEKKKKILRNTSKTGVLYWDFKQKESVIFFLVKMLHE